MFRQREALLKTWSVDHPDMAVHYLSGTSGSSSRLKELDSHHLARPAIHIDGGLKPLQTLSNFSVAYSSAILTQVSDIDTKVQFMMISLP